jgi:hypothetical protein
MISFDFDNTLTRAEVLVLAKKLQAMGHKLMVCTARSNDHGEVTDFLMFYDLDIPIAFSKQLQKHRYLKIAEERSGEKVLHIDDTSVEVEMCNLNGIKAINTFPIETLELRINKFI